MKKILAIVNLMIALLFSISYRSIPLAVETSSNNLKVNPDQIKNSTLLIVVESIQPTGIKLGYGMGTLVQYLGETYLVTHNHFGDLLQDMNILELRNSENRMIKTIYGKKFKSLILYQDAGTMVLRAPDGLISDLTPGDMDDTRQLKAGDTVQVAYRGQPDRDRTEVLDAVVTEVGLSGVVPVYTIRSLNGPRLHPGDSGGGVWYNGKLVANSWAVLTTSSVVESSGQIDHTDENFTDLSYGAILPEVFKSGVPALIQQ